MANIHYYLAYTYSDSYKQTRAENSSFLDLSKAPADDRAVLVEQLASVISAELTLVTNMNPAMVVLRMLDQPAFMKMHRGRLIDALCTMEDSDAVKGAVCVSLDKAFFFGRMYYLTDDYNNQMEHLVTTNKDELIKALNNVIESYAKTNKKGLKKYFSDIQKSMQSCIQGINDGEYDPL